MKQISLDNGRTYMTAAEAIQELSNPYSGYCGGWDAILNTMDDDTAEAVHDELAPCTEQEFLARYLEIADHDLIIG